MPKLLQQLVKPAQRRRRSLVREHYPITRPAISMPLYRVKLYNGDANLKTEPVIRQLEGTPIKLGLRVRRSP